MENEIISKRGLVIALVIVSVVIFIGLVWLIATYQPWKVFIDQSPTATPSALVSRDCTYPVTYWRVHPELYPAQIIIGGMVYREFELEALLLDVTQEPAQLLKAQMAVAFLNGQAGADQSVIEATLFDAYGWLQRHPVGSLVSGEELDQEKQLYSLLEAYNLGLAGVAPCEATQLATLTSTLTQTARLEISLTPSSTGTPTPSQTAIQHTPTLVPTRLRPSNTPIPPTQKPEQPSDTPAPTWTNVPVNTTQAPSPTVPTDTPTLPPPEPTLP